MLSNKKFDLVISLGEDCACSGWLRRFSLQKYSYPFDWLSNADFETRINLIINDFQDFLNYDDIKFMNIENPTIHDSYKDIKYNFHYYHDFEKNIPLSISYDEVKEKYDRRIKRLYDKIEASNSMLFVWYSKDKCQNTEGIEASYLNLQNKFKNKDINLLIIENSETDENIELQNGHVLILHYDCASYTQNPKWNKTMGNEYNNSLIFKQVKINKKVKYYLLDFLNAMLKLFVNFLPTKKMRHKCREYIKVKIDHAKL